jgi:type IV pilus assembly protein PilC/MSHA biogenesis protein MshG
MMLAFYYASSRQSAIMPTFEYEATQDDGRTVRGTEFGLTVEQVIQNLALRGLLVTKIAGLSGFDPIPDTFAAAGVARGEIDTPPPAEDMIEPQGPITEASAPTHGFRSTAQESDLPQDLGPRSYFATHIWGPLVGEVPLTSLALFFRQFASMVGAGVPLVTALETLGRQEHSPKLSRIIGEMRAATVRGASLSGTMQRYPEVFSPLQVSLTRASEEGGFLEKAAKLNAEYLETDIEIRNVYRRETLYPKFVIGFSIAIICFANSIIHLFGSARGIYSPLTDPAVDFFVVPLAIAILLFVKIGLPNPRIRYNWDNLKLRIPYLGPTLHQFAMAKFGRALGALHKGGIPPGRALILAADACGNEYLRSQIYPAAQRLEQGQSFAETLGQTSAFTPLVMDMVSTGEMAGSLDEMLDKICEYYEAEAKVRAQQAGRVIGVFALVCVGIYVGFVVISFFVGMMSTIGSEIPQSGFGGN